MVQMSLQAALHDNVELVHSSVKTEIAPLQQQFVMEPMTVETVLMNNNATCLVRNWNLSVVPMAVASWIAGNVTVIQTVKTVLMKIQVFVIKENVILQHNSLAKMVDVYPNCGCVILITIVVMIPMNLRTCVGKKIVQQDGNAAQEGTITDAFQSGSSVMVKMIVETNPTNCQKTVHCATPTRISNATTTVAFPNSGNVTFQTIAVTVPMKY
jgi:hypothetical protein